MRQIFCVGATIISLGLTACGNAEVRKEMASSDGSNKFGLVEPMDPYASYPEESVEYEAPPPADSSPSPKDSTSAGEIKVGQDTKSETQRLPQIAYSYSLSYQTETGSVGPLQKAHADLCEKAGQDKCHILSMEQSDAQADYGRANLKLEVRADYAREFINSLGKAAEKADATQTDSAIEGVDLSKEIVDTEARLASRKLLRERLMKILATKSGSVQELVEAERAVAQVTEEIEVAESSLADMKGRVRFSALDIDYSTESMSEGSFWNPIARSLAEFGAVLGWVIGGIISFVAFFLPIAVFIAFLVWIIRLLRRRGFLHFGIRRRWRQFRGRPEPAAD